MNVDLNCTSGNISVSKSIVINQPELMDETTLEQMYIPS